MLKIAYLFLIMVLLGSCLLHIPSQDENYITEHPTAHFNIVPYRTFESLTKLGVVAFHIDGIEKVEYTIVDKNGDTLMDSVNVMTFNDRTGINEYWVKFNLSELSDGPLMVFADVKPNNGVTRHLDITIMNNSKHSLLYKNFYVHPTNGNDISGDGSSQSPFRTLTRALDYNTVSGGDNVILMVEGHYEAPYRNAGGDQYTMVDRYITIKPAPNLDRDEVVIISSNTELRTFLPKVSHLKWENVTLDFTYESNHFFRYMTRDNDYLWFDRCRITDNIPNLADMEGSTYVGNIFERTFYYVTDSVAERGKFGFIYTALVRNSSVSNIIGDCYQMSKCILNCTVSDIDWEVVEHHTDIYQLWDEKDNILIYGLTGTNIFCQSFILEPDRENKPGIETLRNSAFIDISIDNYYKNPEDEKRGGPPFSFLLGNFENVLFKNINLSEQQIQMNVENLAQPFTAKNVVFDNFHFFDYSYDRYVVGQKPLGVTFLGCHK
ncbi:MAG: DUF1565 domain-containing protein [Spirochaetales bacterium]|nr:DUF1565 domain-containing protein [Spirochaetales bacterium]